MSLAVLADHMASKGRGPDSMLIHMSPREVQGLQALAMKNGGSLTINPETGLPEAGILDKLLPAVIGAGVSYFSGGTINPAMIGLGVGAFESVRTGDLGRGISAGLGAYGGAGLGEGLMNAGIGSMSQAAGAGLSEEAAQQAVASKLASATPMETLSAGAKSITDSPKAFGTFAKNNLKYGMSAISPVLADQAVKSGMPTTTTSPAQMRRFSYDPYSQRYTPIGNYEVPRKTEEAAGGGLMGMNDGGYSPGQLNFAERSEPVVRMAGGGVPGYAGTPADGSLVGAAQPPQTIQGLYESIGRKAEDIDQAGLDYWSNQLLGSGDTTISADDLSHFRNAAQPELANRSPAIQQPMMAATNVATGTPTVGAPSPVAPAAPIVAPAPAPAAPTIAKELETRYQNLLYRAPDEKGLQYWTDIVSKDGVFSDAEKAAFDTAAKPEQMVGDIYRNVLGRDPDASGLTYWTGRINAGEPPEKVYAELLAFANKNAENVAADTSYGSATKAYGGYRSTDQVSNVDEWVRNTLGRDPTPEDRKQPWYKDAVTAMNKTATAKEAIDSTNAAYGQFQTYAKGAAPAVIAQNIKEATASLAARGLTEADVIAQTGKTIAELITSGIDPNKSLAAASQLRPLGAKTGFDFSGIKKAPTKTLLNTNPQTNAPTGTTNPYGNVNNPGDITRNADGSTTVTPNIPGRPFGGFSGMGEVKDAYTGGGGSLGYTSPVPKTMDEFNARYNKSTGGSKQAYDYLTGKNKYSATPFTETGEIMKPYAESVLGVAPNIAVKKVLFDPITRTYKHNPDYIPVTYTPEGKKVYGKSDNQIKAALAAVPEVKTGKAGGLLGLAGGGMPGYSGAGDSLVKDNTANFANWVKVNNISMEQVARALGISIAEAEKKYGTKGDAKDEISGFKGYAGYGEPTGNDPSVDSNPGWSGKTDAEKAAYYGENPTMASVTRGLQTAFGFTGLGRAQNFFDPDRVSREGLIAMGVDPTAYQGAKEGFRASEINAMNEQANYDRTLADLSAAVKGAEYDVDAQNNAEIGQGEQDAIDAANNAGAAAAEASGPSGLGTADGGDGWAHGGLTALAQGGMYNLGDYSDGGRLLRGPGDGVSDSIPATIGKKRPARLADGEFVVPARIVSELGNGSTEAGARKLYAMMDRIQAARRSSIGKGKVAKNSRADKYLPA